MALLITQPSLAFRPVRYPQARAFWEVQAVHGKWTHFSIGMQSSIEDWNMRMTKDERTVVRRILQLFTQTEVAVETYWSRFIPTAFPSPEIAGMAHSFAAMEYIHAEAYNYLSDSLGLPHTEHGIFLTVPALRERMEKLDSYLEADPRNPAEVARSIAVFSAFIEGTALFANFAALLSFQLSEDMGQIVLPPGVANEAPKVGRLKGVADIIAYSYRDESLHSEAGCWLFRTLMADHPELWTDDFKRTIYQAARDAVAREEDFVDYVFDGIPDGAIRNVTRDSLKEYIRYRADVKLGDLGLKANWGVERHAYGWVDDLAMGREFADFFNRHVSGYQKDLGAVTGDDLFG